MVIFIFIFFQWAFANPDTTITTEAQKHLRQAQTWYRLARATENDMDAHQNAEKEYQKALELLKNDETEQAEKLRKQAEQGIAQSISRIDNAHDTFRNVFWPSWWITESDNTVEWYDDVYMLAVGNAWTSIEKQLESDVQLEKVPVLIRASRNPALPSLPDEEHVAFIDLLQDEMVGIMSTRSDVNPLPADLGQKALGTLWPRFLKHEKITPKVANEILSTLGSERFMTVDLTLIDEIEEQGSTSMVARVLIDVHIWTKDNPVPQRIISQGVGQNAKAHTMWAILWIGGLFLCGVACVLSRQKKSARKNSLSTRNIVLIGAIAFIGGSFLGEIAGEISEQFLPEWGTPAYLREYDFISIPFPPVLLWPLVHGFIVMGGPLLILAWLVIKFSEDIGQFIEDPTSQIQVIAPAAQAGAATWMFFPMVMAIPGKGFITAFPLAFTAIICSFVLANPLFNVLSGRDKQRQEILAILFGFSGLLLILPIGLFDNYFWLASVIGLVLSLLCWQYSKEIKEEEKELEEEKAAEIILDETIENASLENPPWVTTTEFQPIIQHLTEKTPLRLIAEPGQGASRFIQELAKQITASSQKVVHVKTPEPTEEGVLPYALIKQMLEQLQVKFDLVEQEKRAQNIQRTMAGLEGFVGGLPGLGAITGLMGSGDEDGSTMLRSRVISDGAKALQIGLKKKKISVLLVEDLHYIDPSSLEILEYLFQMDETECTPIWNSRPSFEEEHQDYWEDITARVVDISVPNFTNEHAEQLVINCGIEDISVDLVHDLNEKAGGNPKKLHKLLLMLRDTNMISENEDGRWSPTAELTTKNILKNLPSDLRSMEAKRLEDLTKEQRMILDTAAVSGLQFSIKELIEASNFNPLYVSRMLHEIEMGTSPPLIHDIREVEGEFRFTSSLTQEALLELLKDHNGNYCEFANLIHQEIVDAGTNDDTYRPGKLAYHAFHAGSRYQDQLLGFLVRWTEEHARQRAWPELIDVVEEYKPKLYAGNLDPILLTKLDLMHARALRFIGDKQSKLKAISLLEKHLETAPEFDTSLAFDIAYTWCEIRFEAKETVDVQALCDKLTILLKKEQPVLINILLQFYLHLTKLVLKQTRSIAPLMKQLLQNIEAETSTEQQKFLRSIVLQTYGNRIWQEESPPREPPSSDISSQEWQVKRAELNKALWQTKALPILEEALSIKEEIDDIQGQAMNLGIRGGAYLYVLRDLDAAIDCFAKDLEICQRHGLDTDVSGTANKLSTAYWWKSATEQNASEKSKFQQLAEDNAIVAWECAVRLDRKVDMAFAGNQCIEILCTQLQNEATAEKDDLIKKVNDIGNQMASIDWKEVTNAYAKSTFQKHLQTFASQSYEWMKRAKESVQTT